MALFDFVKDAGKKINQQLDLAREVKEMGIPIENEKIQMQNGVVKVSGKVQSQEDREKVILTLGNLEGVAQVEDTLEVPSKEAEAQFYTVKSGDTLSKIAKQYYGDAGKYPKIFEANKPMLKHPDKIYPGQVLRIPE